MRSPRSSSRWLAILAAALGLVAAGVAYHRAARGRGSAGADPDGVVARIDAFWSWWHTAAPRLAAAFDQGRAASTVEELSARVDAIAPRLAWETGPGLKGARHHLALSSEGDLEVRVLIERWLARAPAPDAAWEYYPARQATPGDPKFSLTLDDVPGVTIAFADARIYFETDTAREILHVTIHHPAFAKLSDAERTRAAFLVLDDTIGEDSVERWIGTLETSVAPLPKGKPLGALEGAVRALAKSATGEQFATLEGRTTSGRPTIAVANLALKRLDHILMDHHLELVMPFREEANQRMPTGEENAALNELEDELLESLGGEAVWIGHETGDGRRTIHLHVARQGPAETRTREWARKHADRRIDIALRHDPGWEVLRRWR